MIDLHNITTCVTHRTGSYEAYMKTSIKGYAPVVCIKPLVMGGSRGSGYTSLRAMSDNFLSNKNVFPSLNKENFLSKFDFVEYYSALTMTEIKKTETKEYNYSLKNCTEDQAKKWNTKANSQVNSNFKAYIESTDYLAKELSFVVYNYSLDYFSKAFNCSLEDTVANSSTRLPHADHYILGKSLNNSNYLVISRGFCGLFNYNTSEIIPLIMLMIKEDYIPYYRGANLLGMPIDNSKFEFWINDKIEEMPDFSKVNTYILSAKTSINSKIPIVVKSGLTENFSKYKFPKLESITERIEWLTSTKNDFLNAFHSLKAPLPVKEFKSSEPTIITTTVKFKSRKLNKVISTAVKAEAISSSSESALPKNIPKDKFTLII